MADIQILELYPIAMAINLWVEDLANSCTYSIVIMSVCERLSLGNNVHVLEGKRYMYKFLHLPIHVLLKSC